MKRTKKKRLLALFLCFAISFTLISPNLTTRAFASADPIVATEPETTEQTDGQTKEASQNQPTEQTDGPTEVFSEKSPPVLTGAPPEAASLSEAAQSFVDEVAALDHEGIEAAVTAVISTPQEDDEAAQAAIDGALAPVYTALNNYELLEDTDKEQDEVAEAYTSLSAFAARLRTLSSGEGGTRDAISSRIQVKMTHSSGVNVALDSDAPDVATAEFPIGAASAWVSAPIVVDFPTAINYTKKTVVVSIAHGFIIDSSHSGASDGNLISQLDTSYSKPVEYGAATKVWPDRSNTLADGDVTYHLNSSVSTTTIPLQVRCFANIVGMPSFGDGTTPAIRVEAWADTNGDGVIELLSSTQLTNVTMKLWYPNLYPDQDYEMKAKTDTNVSMLPASGTYYNFRYNNMSQSVGHYNDYAKWYLSAPEHAELVGLQTNPDTPFDTYADMGPDPDKPGNKLYCITIERANIDNLDLMPVWKFPSEYFSNGDEVVISTKKVVMKPWGMEREYIYIPGTADTANGAGISLGTDPVSGYEQIQVEKKSLNSTHTYIIDTGNLAWVNLIDGNSITKPDDLTAGTSSRTVNWRSEGFEDNIGILGAYSIGNRKAEDTEEKTVEFHFDSTDIEVTALTVPMPAGTQLSTVWYKSETNTEWTELTLPTPLSPPADTAANDMGVVLITNDGSLGLPIGEAITDFKYVMPAIPATRKLDGEAESTIGYQKDPYIYGRAVSTENKTVESTIRVYDKDMTAEELAANEDHSKDTGIGIIQTVLAERGMTLALSGTVTKVQSPGTTFSFASNTTFSNVEKPVFSPIFYIRDETKCGINDVKLVNSRGIDLMEKYGLTAQLDHTEEDGTKVYKIDTSAIAEQTTADKYDAAVGAFVSGNNPTLDRLDSNNLTLRYTVTVPSSYVDGSVEHSNAERLYISTNEETSSFTRLTGTVLGDPHDVDGIANNNEPAVDGHGNPAASAYPLVVVEHMATETYYQIYTPPQLNVLTEAKHTKAPDESYMSWAEGEDPLQVNVGTDGGFNVRISLSNDSTARVTDVELYQPIPKDGEDWGALSATVDANGQSVQSPFAWDVNLKEAIAGYDTEKYTVMYGIGITPTDYNIALRNQAAKFLTADQVTSDDWSNVNCIKIVTNDGVGLSGGENEQFVMNCTVPQYLEELDQTTNIFKATYYNKRIDPDNHEFADWYLGSPTAIQLCCGSLEGDVYLDVNENGKLDVFEEWRVLHVLDGATISLYKVDHSVSPIQVSTIDENGHYEFHDLYRGAAKYRAVITLPSGEVMAQYELSLQDTDFDENGQANHLFEYTDAGRTQANATALWAAKEIGVKDEPDALNGIYNVLLTDSTLCSVSLEKIVTGNMGDREEEFAFKITLKDEDAAAIEGMFGYDGLGDKEGSYLTFNDSGEATVAFAHGQGIKLIGLPSGTQYSIVETDANQNGYVTSYAGDNNGVVQTETNEEPGTVITNYRNVTAPTGIPLEFWPSFLIVILAMSSGIALVCSSKKKRRFADGYK